MSRLMFVKYVTLKYLNILFFPLQPITHLQEAAVMQVYIYICGADCYSHICPFKVCLPVK